MPAPKGKSMNPNGKKPGTLNKTTKQTKELITLFMQDKFEDVMTTWEGLPPVDKVKTYFSLIKFVMPVQSAVSLQDQNGDDFVEKFLEQQKKK